MPDVRARLQKVFGRKVIPDKAVKEILDGNRRELLKAYGKIGAAHNESIGCRSSDLFHVAAALEWKADQFLTFDERQKKMARAAGLTVKAF